MSKDAFAILRLISMSRDKENRIHHWLAAKLSRLTSTRSTEERSVSKEYKPDEPVTSSAQQAKIDDLMPDIYGEETGNTQPDCDTQPLLEIIENPSRTSEMSEGFDPYNTGVFKSPKK